MEESYEKGVANHSAPSVALGTARCTAKRKRVFLEVVADLRREDQVDLSGRATG